MDDVLRFEQPEAAQKRAREPPDEAQAKALVVVLFDQFIQVYTEKKNR